MAENITVNNLPVTIWETNQPILSVAISPQGHLIAGGGEQGRLFVWDIGTRELDPKFQTPAFEQDRSGHMINSVAFSPDGHTLASAGGVLDETGVLCFWDVETGKPVRSVSAHTDICRLAFEPDSRMVATGGGNGAVKLWDLETGALLRTMVHGARVNRVSFSSDGQVLASGGYELHGKKERGQVKLWDVKTGNLLSVLAGDNQGVYALAYSPDNRFLAAGVYTKKAQLVEVWDVQAGRMVHTLPPEPGTVFSISFSSDGRRFAYNSWDGVTCWNLVEARVEWKIKTPSRTGYSGAISVALSFDDRILASSFSDNTVRLWRMP